MLTLALLQLPLVGCLIPLIDRKKKSFAMDVVTALLGWILIADMVIVALCLL